MKDSVAQDFAPEMLLKLLQSIGVPDATLESCERLVTSRRGGELIVVTHADKGGSLSALHVEVGIAGSSETQYRLAENGELVVGLHISHHAVIPYTDAWMEGTTWKAVEPENKPFIKAIALARPPIGLRTAIVISSPTEIVDVPRVCSIHEAKHWLFG